MAIKKTASSGDFKSDSAKMSTPEVKDQEAIDERERKAQEQAMLPPDLSHILNPIPAGQTFSIEVVPDEEEKETAEELKGQPEPKFTERSDWQK